MKGNLRKSMTTNFKKEEYLSPSLSQRVRVKVLRDIRLPLKLLVKGSLPLFVFTALNELASNLVFISLMEKANVVGQGASSVGVVLIIQCIAQLLPGSWAGVAL